MCSAVGNSAGCAAKLNKGHRRPAFGTDMKLSVRRQRLRWKFRWRGHHGTQEKCFLTWILTSLWKEVWEQSEWRQMCCYCWVKRQKRRVGWSADTFQSLSQFSFYGSLRRSGGRLNLRRLIYSTHIKSSPLKTSVSFAVLKRCSAARRSDASVR